MVLRWSLAGVDFFMAAMLVFVWSESMDGRNWLRRRSRGIRVKLRYGVGHRPAAPRRPH